MEPKELKRAILEFETLVILSNHCFVCLKLKEERRLMLVGMEKPMKVNNIHYTYYGVPICLECAPNKPSRSEMIHKIIEALELVPYKIVCADDFQTPDNGSSDLRAKSS